MVMRHAPGGAKRMPRVHRVLGIDPGTATVGFGIVDWLAADTFQYIASGVISTPKTMLPGMRLKMIREDLLDILAEFGADQVGVEALFFFKNAKTLVPVAQARGVILETLSTFGLTPGEYTPMQVKMQLTGYGKAEKPEVQWAVAKLLGLSQIIKPDDASDALAIAVTHARMTPAIHIGDIKNMAGSFLPVSSASGLVAESFANAETLASNDLPF